MHKFFLLSLLLCFLGIAEPITTKSKLELQSGKTPELTIEAQGSILETLGVRKSTPVAPPIAPSNLPPPSPPSSFTDSDTFFKSIGKQSEEPAPKRRRKKD